MRVGLCGISGCDSAMCLPRVFSIHLISSLVIQNGCGISSSASATISSLWALMSRSQSSSPIVMKKTSSVWE